MKSITDELRELEQWTQTQEFHDSDIEHINKVYARIDALKIQSTTECQVKNLFERITDSLMDKIRTPEQREKIEAQNIYAKEYGKTSAVSFSGGRTSAYMVYLIEQMRKSGEWQGNVEYIFMDTGAEHPKTYEFIKKCVEYFGIELICLRGSFNQSVGDGHTYEVISVDEIGYDPVNGPYAQLVRKYGLPTISSAWCTSRMKEETHDKYCNDRFGAGNYVTWLGIRSDEPKRLKIGKRKDLRYMAEITDFEKSDVLDFWRKMPFDLGIDEHLGNCVFCFKKSHSKIALAARDEPELFMDWICLLNSGSDRNTAFKKQDLLGDQEFNRDKLAIHRNRKTPQDIIAMFSLFDDFELKEQVYRNSKDSGGCSESCEAFATQIELF